MQKRSKVQTLCDPLAQTHWGSEGAPRWDGKRFDQVGEGQRVFAGRAGSVNRSLYEKVSGSLPPPPPARVLWCWKCPLLCLPVRQLSMTRKPMLTRAGRGRWRWRAVLQGPKLSRCQSKEEKKACLGVAGLFWMSHVVPGWCIVTVVCPSGICDHCF